MNAELCYRQGCEYWVTGASDFCSEECERLAAGDRYTAAVRAAQDAYENYRQRVMLGLTDRAR